MLCLYALIPILYAGCISRSVIIWFNGVYGGCSACLRVCDVFSYQVSNLQPYVSEEGEKFPGAAIGLFVTSFKGDGDLILSNLINLLQWVSLQR